MKRTAALRYPTPKAPGSPIVRHAVPPEPPTGPLVRVAISSDGRVLATAGADGWLHVVELEVGRVAFSVDLGAPVVDLTHAKGPFPWGTGPFAYPGMRLARAGRW